MVKNFTPPVRPRLARLPFSDPAMTWEGFEDFCLDYVNRRPDVKSAHFYGTRGSKQKGIDIFADMLNGERWAFQCRHWKTITPANIDKTVREASYEANRYLILLSSEATTAARDQCDKHTNWDIWDGRDLSHRAREMSPDQVRDLLDSHFGLIIRREFLTSSSVGAFLTPEQFFAPYLEPERLFHHRLPQVGRRQQIGELLSFVAGSKRIAMLPGRGGNGKSKLLHTLCRRLARRERDLLILLKVESSSIRAEDLHELPTGRTLVIVDDAHRGDGLEVLLGLARQKAELQVLLVTRPHASDYLTAQVRNAGFDRTETEALAPLPDLNFGKEVKRLARCVLGREWAGHADALAKVTRDCPLLTVLGGELLRSKQIPPELLLRDNDFRQEVLGRFRDVQFGEFISQMGSRFSPQLCADVLPLIAVTTPLNGDDHRLLDALAKLAGTDVVKLKQLIGAMTEAGILVRGGRLVRIVPDVLSDFILHEACLTRDGQPTGWATWVYEALEDLRLDSVLRNLAELDWRIRTTPHEEPLSSSETSLLSQVWNDIEHRFRSCSLAERVSWLNRLERTAFMAPERLWRVAEMTRDEPVPEDPEEVSPDQKMWIKPTSQGDVLTALLPILRGIACDARYTARCADWLWELGRDVEAAPGNRPGAMVTLSELAGYERHKPVAFNQIILDRCREWLRDPLVHSYSHSVLEVLTPMFARQIHWSESDGRYINYGSFIMARTSLVELRQEALELVEQCALCGERSVVLASLNCLQVPLGEQDLWQLKKDDPKEWSAWEEEQLAALDIVGRVATSNADPFVRLKIWDELHWQAEQGPRPVVRRRAREVLGNLPHSFESRFILLLTGSHSRDTYHRSWEVAGDTDEDWLAADEPARAIIDERRANRNAEFARQVTKEWVAQFSDPRQGFTAFNEWAKEVEESGWWELFRTRWNSFVLQLAVDFPDYARAWCEIALEEPDSRVAGRCDDLLYQLRLQNHDDALCLAQRFMANGHPNLWLRVAASYSFRGWPQTPRDEEWAILRQLLDHDHCQVRRSAAGIVAAVATHDTRRAIELVLQTNLREDTAFADKLYSIFEERRHLDFALLSPNELKMLLDKLENVESVKVYHLGRFFLQAALVDPIAVADLLLRRVCYKNRLDTERLQSASAGSRLVVKNAVDEFGGLPEQGFHDTKMEQVAAHPQYMAALRLIRDAALLPEFQHTLLYEDTLSELFRDFSLNFSAHALEVLNEWIDSGDCVKVEAVMRLLGDSYMGFYFDNTPFVSNYLRAAKRCGSAVLEAVERKMTHYAVYGPPRAVASHRGERSNALFHGASGALEKVKGDFLSTHFYAGLRDEAQSTIRDEMQRDAEQEVFVRSQ